MMSLMKRKQELIGLIELYNNSDGKNLISVLHQDLNDIILVEGSKIVGREFSLAKRSNPLLDIGSEGKSTNLALSTVQTQTLLEKSKLLSQILNIDELNREILHCGDMAKFFYKTKNDLMTHVSADQNTGPYKLLKVQCKRMI
jgi:hypothetical protein